MSNTTGPKNISDEVIQAALERNDWNIAAAARELDVTPNTVRHRIRVRGWAHNSPNPSLTNNLFERFAQLSDGNKNDLALAAHLRANGLITAERFDQFVTKCEEA